MAAKKAARPSPKTKAKAKTRAKPRPRSSKRAADAAPPKAGGAPFRGIADAAPPKAGGAPFRGTADIDKLRPVRGVSLRGAKLDVLRGEIERQKKALARWNANPEDVQRSVAQLVLSLVEFLRKLLERQAIRRMEGETLDPDEVERIGLALMRLEETVHEMASRFGLDPSELNLDLGPLGRLV